MMPQHEGEDLRAYLNFLSATVSPLRLTLYHPGKVDLKNTETCSTANPAHRRNIVGAGSMDH